MNQSIFKAYDIRGKYPSEINEKIVSEIISRFLTKKLKNQKNKKLVAVVGRDARLSSPKLYKSVISSLKIKNLKLKILPVGIATTPMLYFLVNHYKADFGIMITASHNPKEYNGLKIVGKKAVPVGGKKVFEIISR